MRNCFILNTQQGFFASLMNQSGFRKGSRSHSMYSEYITDALNLTPVICPQHLSPMPSGIFPLVSSKSHCASY